MKKLILIVLVAALAIPTAAHAQPSSASYCSRVAFHRSVTQSVAKAGDAFDWYEVEAYNAAMVAIKTAERMARAQVPCVNEDRRVKALQINTYVRLYKAFRARRNGDLGAAGVHLEAAGSNWEKLTVIAARW